MAKSKLLSALDVHKGRNLKLEKDKKLRKTAEKRKRVKRQRVEEESDGEKDLNHVGIDGSNAATGKEPFLNGNATEDASTWIDESGDESDVVNQATSGAPEIATNGTIDHGEDEADAPNQENEENEEDEVDEQDEEDLPLSDLDSLPSEDREDIIPHQRLTINNTAALRSALTSIAVPVTTLPFSEHQSLISTTALSIPDPNDDLVREQAFYQQCLASAKLARSLLKKEGVPFSRPADYFAEMVKSDEHMGRVKKKLYDEAAAKKASQEARKQRDLKKFGKQVQVEKLQERQKAKREGLERVESLKKRKRKGDDTGAAGDEDMFDIALDDSGKADKSRDRSGGKSDRSKGKRQKKDQKYGFGGKKRFGKSGDAASSADMSGFSAKRMKGQKKGAKRLGKSRRTKA